MRKEFNVETTDLFIYRNISAYICKHCVRDFNSRQRSDSRRGGDFGGRHGRSFASHKQHAHTHNLGNFRAALLTNGYFSS